MTSSPDAKSAWIEMADTWLQLLENERRWGWAEPGGYRWPEMIGLTAEAWSSEE
jgi:hypothetical protein